MASEKPLPEEATAKNLLGLESRLIERTPPLPQPETYKEDIGTVLILWPETPSFSGGRICLTFAERVHGQGGLVKGEPKIIASYFAINRSLTAEPAPAGREGVAAFLTMSATINEAAQKLEQPLLHVVRANKDSLPYFERLHEAGLYRCCNQDGNPSPHRIMAGHYTLFSCEYPVEELDTIIGKFTVEEAADLLVEVYKDLKGQSGNHQGH